MNKKKSSKQAASNKGLTVAVVAAIALLIVVVMGALLVTQSPEKQIAKGFANLIEAKTIGVDGSSKTESGTSKSSASIVGATDFKTADLQITFSTSTAGTSVGGKAQVLVADDGAMYAKVDQPAKLMEEYAKVSIANMTAPGFQGVNEEQRKVLQDSVAKNFAATGAKLEGKWIKFDDNSVNAVAGSSKGVSCYTAFTQTLTSDKKARKQLANAFKNNQFFKVENEIESDGSAKGYRVGFDQAKVKDFKDSVKDNEAVKQLGSCGTDILTLGATDSFNDQTADIWVDSFSHKITRIKYTKPQDAGGRSSVDIKLSYDKKVDVTAPSDTIAPDTIFGSAEAAKE